MFLIVKQNIRIIRIINSNVYVRIFQWTTKGFSLQQQHYVLVIVLKTEYPQVSFFRKPLSAHVMRYASKSEK